MHNLHKILVKAIIVMEQDSNPYFYVIRDLESILTISLSRLPEAGLEPLLHAIRDLASILPISLSTNLYFMPLGT